MKKTVLLLLSTLGFYSVSPAQEQWNTARILHEIEKVPQRTTVLYIAAHPDDENTRMITWLANEKKFRTAYLSLTRGDGGQNLIGKELGTGLGMIRSFELGEARKIDGGEQYFTRAFDFGFSKTPGETLQKWNKDSLLADMVYVIRTLQPQVMITRFPAGNYPTHGHHTTSALLAAEAFRLAADPKAFPDQIKSGIEPWQCQLLLFNASTWMNPRLDSLAQKNDSFFVVDVGGYNALLGASYSEIAGRSRSMHKSQGFGSAEPVGKQPEYLQILASASPDIVSKNKNNPFERVENPVSDKLFIKELNESIKITDNKQVIFDLTKIVKALDLIKSTGGLYSGALKEYKVRQLENILIQASALSVKITGARSEYAQSSTHSFFFRATNRSKHAISITGWHSGSQTILTEKTTPSIPLLYNEVMTDSLRITFAPRAFSQAPWLKNGKDENMFRNSWRDGGTLPGTHPQFTIRVSFNIEGYQFEREFPIEYERVDPVKGELRWPVLVWPQLEFRSSRDLVLLNETNASSFTFQVKLHGNQYQGPLITGTEGNFNVQRSFNREIDLLNDSLWNGQIQLSANKGKGNGRLILRGAAPLIRVEKIEYDHIGPMHLCSEAQIQLSRLDLKKTQKRIAYVQGAGDEVDEYLRLAGFMVNTILPADVVYSQLKQYDVVVFGIRAFNTHHFSDECHKDLLRFMEEGGNVIVQYNTNRGIISKLPSPFLLQLGRGRVVDENAEVRILSSAHPAVTVPYVLGPDDFEHWKQERGLYFSEKAGPEFQSIFSMNDAGEDPLNGALVIADYGKGSFIYTGLAFFRQIPAGVPGAYRLFSNLIEYEPKK